MTTSNESIAIDFQGGAHGNFLEFVCNIVAGVRTESNPFNSKGASHKKNYLDKKIFHAKHFSFAGNPLPKNCSKIIAIKISADDLLPLSQISLLRAGDRGIDNDELEIDTYHKLYNIPYMGILNDLRRLFFESQIETSYNNVKDPSWPDVKTLEDFENLPSYIKEECIKIHKLVLLDLSEARPNCPRFILREFFQIGFEQPSLHGFMIAQKNMIYSTDMDVFEFGFENFYNEDKFLNKVKQISKWANLDYNEWERIEILYREFLKRQPYKDSKIKSDKIIKDLINNNIEPPKVTLIEEAYINAKLNLLGYGNRY